MISFDYEKLATYLRPQVTTMRIPYLEMGEVGTEILLSQIGVTELATGSTGQEIDAETLVPMPLIERGSVADVN